MLKTVTLLSFLALCAHAQKLDIHPDQIGPRPPVVAAPQFHLPADIHVCAAACTDWISTGAEFYLKWTNGTYSPIAVQSFTPESVIMHRADLPGTQSPGLEAIYTGKISGNTITGIVAFTWADHAGFPASTKFTATWSDTALNVPPHPAPIAAIRAQLAREQANEQALKSFIYILGAMFGGGDDGYSASLTARENEAARKRRQQELINQVQRDIQAERARRQN